MRVQRDIFFTNATVLSLSIPGCAAMPCGWLKGLRARLLDQRQREGGFIKYLSARFGDASAEIIHCQIEIIEDQPWWSVDLGSNHIIYGVRIFNRLEQEALMRRGAKFRIDLKSDSSSDWLLVCLKNDDTLFGGADGYPFTWIANKPIGAQHVRIKLLERNFLHFEEIQVFGYPITK